MPKIIVFDAKFFNLDSEYTYFPFSKPLFFFIGKVGYGGIIETLSKTTICYVNYVNSYCPFPNYLCVIVEDVSYGAFVCNVVQNNKIVILIFCILTSYFQNMRV